MSNVVDEVYTWTATYVGDGVRKQGNSGSGAPDGAELDETSMAFDSATLLQGVNAELVSGDFSICHSEWIDWSLSLVPLTGGRIGTNFLSVSRSEVALAQLLVTPGTRLGVVATCYGGENGDEPQPIPSFDVTYTFTATEVPSEPTATFD